jgi:serine phosphatase RsbU (regulator of sigma subunit)
VLTKLNRALLGADIADPQSERFCTAMLGVLSSGADPVVALGSGGHNPPILRRHNGGVEEIPVPGSLLGVLEEAPMGARVVTLAPGDTLVFYTDGATEARRDGVIFGSGGLMAAIAAAPAGAHSIAAAIESAVLTHTGGTISDDLAALVIHAKI